MSPPEDGAGGLLGPPVVKGVGLRRAPKVQSNSNSRAVRASA